MSDERLSDFSIEDPVLRVELYKKILAYITDTENDVLPYEIKADEQTNPELLAYRLYKTGDLRWVVGIVCSVTDEFSPIPVGEQFYFPSITVIREFIKEVKDSASS